LVETTNQKPTDNQFQRLFQRGSCLHDSLVSLSVLLGRGGEKEQSNRIQPVGDPLTRPGKEPQKTYGKDPPLLMGKSTISTGPFSIAFC